jgi:hypothetical protein
VKILDDVVLLLGTTDNLSDVWDFIPFPWSANARKLGDEWAMTPTMFDQLVLDFPWRAASITMQCL